MKIVFNKQHKSIKQFDEAELQDFSVFIGPNGSGKTHLLQAIKWGFVKVDSIQVKNISLFNFQNFLVKNQKNINQRTIDDQKHAAWKVLLSLKDKIENYDKQIKAILWDQALNPYKSKVEDEQKVIYDQNINALFSQIESRTSGSLKVGKLIKTGIIESGKFASEVTYEEFSRHTNFEPDDYELLENLSEIFMDFQKKLVLAKLPKEENWYWLSNIEIEALQQKAPWNFINNMFKEFGLSHSLNCPDFKIWDLVASPLVEFQVNLTINSSEFGFEDLSSGEKILCALAVTVYQDNKTHFPELLLLDEIDASLHPSMIKNLLSVIENIFLKNGCKVILATHSPTTTALVDESSLFEIKKGDLREKIIKISQNDAINILSEGIMTLEKWLKIFDAIFQKDLTIISEGKNQKHIKKAIEILDKNLMSKIQFYEHDSGSGVADLFGLFEFIKKTNVPKKVLFIWDCDAKTNVEKKSESINVFKFCFDKNTKNDICQKGIENMYPEGFFTKDLIKKISIEEGGIVITKVEFSDSQKNNLLKKVDSSTDIKIFEWFQPLIEKIKLLI